MSHHASSNGKSLIWQALWVYRYWITLYVTLIVIEACLLIAVAPHALGHLVDTLQCTGQTNGAIQLVTVALILYVGTTALVIVSGRLYEWVLLKLRPNLSRYLAKKLMERMMVYPQTYYQNNLAGQLGSAVDNISNHVPEILEIICSHFLYIVLCVCIPTAVLDAQSKTTLLLVFWVWIIMSMCLVGLFYRRSYVLGERSAGVRLSLLGYVVDVFKNIINVCVFRGHATERKRLGSILRRYVRAHQRLDMLFIKMFSFQGLLLVLYQLAYMGLLVQAYLGGHMSFGDCTMVIYMNATIIEELWVFPEYLSHFTDLATAVTRSLSKVWQPLPPEPLNAKPLVVTRGCIVFDRVTFAYEAEGKPLFKRMQVTITPGQKVGLLGYFGSGKTTFASLILGLFSPSEGRITIDGQDISQVNRESLYKAVSWVPQNPFLFHRSVLDNIRYARPGASEAEVIRAAQQVHAHAFIQQLPRQYHTIVGEQGSKLSGGQIQCIALVRAFLKPAPILIFDEATSQLDVDTDQHIHRSLAVLARGKTTLVIAHRLSKLVTMDRILVFQAGKIIQDGKHDVLLEQPGLYRNMWYNQ